MTRGLKTGLATSIIRILQAAQALVRRPLLLIMLIYWLIYRNPM